MVDTKFMSNRIGNDEYELAHGDVDDSETKALLEKVSNENKYSIDQMYRNFYVMAIAFSLNHGCVVACLAYASTELGDDLGSVASGILYVFYGLSALLLAKPFVSVVGSKLGLLWGMAGYAAYVGGFCLSLLSMFFINTPLAWGVACASAAVGGIAGGVVWTAQGRYFAKHTQLFSNVTSTPIETVTSKFAGLFAAIFLGLEMLLKLTGTLIFLKFPAFAPVIAFTLYMVIAALSCILISSFSNLQDEGTVQGVDIQSAVASACSTASMVARNNQLALMLPFQVAFGLVSSFVPYYIFGTVIADSDTLGSAYVGILSSFIVFVGALTAIPASWLTLIVGKPVLMTVGGGCLMVTGAMFFYFSDDELGQWSMIIPLLLLVGVGRGTWVSDYFVTKKIIQTL